MIKVAIARIKADKEARVRNWLEELNRRADEVRETFVDETVRAEQGMIVPTSDGPLFVHVMEAEDFERGRQAYARSTHAIDQEHRAVMDECLEAFLSAVPIYDVSIDR
jgi:hypothetical protein